MTTEKKENNRLDECRETGLHILETLTGTKTDQGTRFESPTITPSFLASASCLVFLTTWKGGFIFGGDHGTGFAIARKSPQRDGIGSWSAPCFVKCNRLQFGCVCGMEKTQTLMASMTRRAVSHLEEGSHQVVGVDVSLQLWPLIPAGGPNDTANLDIMNAGGPDWLAASFGEGILLDVSVSDGKLEADKSMNRKVYGNDITTKDIFEGKIPRPVEMQPLYDKLNKLCMNVYK